MTSEATIKQPSLKDLIASLILKAHVPERHAARNALAHIEKAWILKDIDPAMAAFRAITGVEEATTAIFHALKRKGYNKADYLEKNRHHHKAAIQPFLSAIATVLDSLGIKVQLHFDSKGKHPKLKIAILSPFDDGFLYPDPPLHYLVLANGTTHDFSPEINSIITTQNVKTFCEYSRTLAEERNKILYASHNGIPSIKITDKYLQRKESLIVTLLSIFLLISQYNERQLFVQQALDAYVKTLNLADKKNKNRTQQNIQANPC